MTFQVSNGSIPATVETWLRGDLGLVVSGPARMNPGRRRLEMVRSVSRDLEADGEETHHVHAWWGFDWPHDRDPSLQEAIEAVMRG